MRRDRTASRKPAIATPVVIQYRTLNFFSARMAALTRKPFSDIGVQIATETTTQVWARLQSATRAEFYSAGQNGLQPSLVAVTPIANYAGQKLAEWRGTRYSIYRTYFATGSDEIELYLEEKVGNDVENG